MHTPTTSSGLAGSESIAVSISTPAAVQTGSTSDCVEFYKAATGDNCWSITQDYDISLDDIYNWNPAVAGDCGGIWLNEYYCVSISCSTTPPGTDSNPISLSIILAVYNTSRSVIIQSQPTVSEIPPPGIVPPFSLGKFLTTSYPDAMVDGASSAAMVTAGSASAGVVADWMIMVQDMAQYRWWKGRGSEDNPDTADEDDSAPPARLLISVRLREQFIHHHQIFMDHEHDLQTLCYTTGCLAEASTTTTTLSTTAASCALPTIASNFPFVFGPQGPIPTSITRSPSQFIIMLTEVPMSSTVSTSDDSEISNTNNGSSDLSPTESDNNGSAATSTSTSTPPLPSNYYKLNLYSDKSCGDFPITAEASANNQYSVGYQPWDQQGVYHGVKLFFDDSICSVAVYKGSDCGTEDPVRLKKFGTCYDVSYR
ncbi:hypothetical protein BJX61DRAFT_545203 [Aspergillus egyptiacus]|nr:hypothetical protein BJX61DRAFT_545203 [Aspergillus egyptiacus]